MTGATTSKLSFKHKNVTDMTSLDRQLRVLWPIPVTNLFYHGADLPLTFLGSLNINCSVTQTFLT